MKPKSIVILIIIIISAIILFQNKGIENISILFWNFNMPLALVILFSLILGFIIGWILHIIYHNHKLAKKDSI